MSNLSNRMLKATGSEASNEGSNKGWLKGLGCIVIATVVLLGFILYTMSTGVASIDKVLADLYAKNPYIQVMVGQDQYIYVLYNKDKEAFAESNVGGVAFYRNDNKMITFGTEEVYIDSDLNPLRFIEAALSVADTNQDTGCSVTAEKAYAQDGTRDGTVYHIHVAGKDNIAKIYQTTGDEEYANISMEMLFASFEDTKDSSVDIYISASGERLGVVCNVTFDGSEYTSWVFDGYIPTAQSFDWKYDSKFYGDVTSMTADEWVELAATTTTDLSQKMQKLMQEENLITNEAATGGVTYNDFISMSDSERQELAVKLVQDIETAGFMVTLSNEDMLKELETYYSTPAEDGTFANQQIDVYQATLNCGTLGGWIIAQETQGIQSDTQEGQVTQEQEPQEQVVQSAEQ